MALLKLPRWFVTWTCSAEPKAIILALQGSHHYVEQLCYVPPALLHADSHRAVLSVAELETDTYAVKPRRPPSPALQAWYRHQCCVKLLCRYLVLSRDTCPLARWGKLDSNTLLIAR